MDAPNNVRDRSCLSYCRWSTWLCKQYILWNS